MNKFKLNLIDLKDIVEKLESCQHLFEKHIVRIQFIQNNYKDLFIKIKQVIYIRIILEFILLKLILYVFYMLLTYF